VVGGAITILKNDGVRQWDGWHPIYEMEHDPFMFETTNQINAVYPNNWIVSAIVFFITKSYSNGSNEPDTSQSGHSGRVGSQKNPPLPSSPPWDRPQAGMNPWHAMRIQAERDILRSPREIYGDNHCTHNSSIVFISHFSKSLISIYIYMWWLSKIPFPGQPSIAQPIA